MESFLEIVVATNIKEVYWHRMIAFCLYAQFLLVSPSGNCDSKILHILNQVEAELNPFSRILAETIVGLDNFLKTKRFSGSPLLFEVWFH